MKRIFGTTTATHDLPSAPPPGPGAPSEVPVRRSEYMDQLRVLVHVLGASNGHLAGRAGSGRRSGGQVVRGGGGAEDPLHPALGCGHSRTLGGHGCVPVARPRAVLMAAAALRCVATTRSCNAWSSGVSITRPLRSSPAW